MRLKDYLRESDTIEWKNYIEDNEMLAGAVSILKKITNRGFQAFIVGGSVRDIILGDSIHDVDIATNMPIDTIAKLWRSYDIGKSKDFGIVVVRENGIAYEIAQFRTDGTYSDGRRPETVTITTSFEDDASRRDLTINAMGIDVDGNIIDYFDGKKDIKNRVIRTVGNPHDRFGEDYLRMMRVPRFAAKLDFRIGTKTKDAIKDLAPNLSKLSVERVKEEIFKAATQSGDKFAKYIMELDDLGILNVILPEIVKYKEFEHSPKHHPEGDVWQHTLEALKVNKVKDPIINLAILLHDIGKTVTFGQKEDGTPTYFGHAEEGMKLVDVIADRLKLSNDERNKIQFAVGNHMRFGEILKMKPSKIAKLVSDDNWDLLVAVSKADDFARGSAISGDFEAIVDRAIEIRHRWGGSKERVTKLVDGRKVMELRGLKPSKAVGHIINVTTEFIIDNNISDQKMIDDFIMGVEI